MLLALYPIAITRADTATGGGWAVLFLVVAPFLCAVPAMFAEWLRPLGRNTERYRMCGACRRGDLVGTVPRFRFGYCGSDTKSKARLIGHPGRSLMRFVSASVWHGNEYRMLVRIAVGTAVFLGASVILCYLVVHTAMKYEFRLDLQSLHMSMIFVMP